MKKIYIASSWRNQHGVELLTDQLRNLGFEVTSWIENNYGETHNHVTKEFDFWDWMKTEQSVRSFNFDTKGAIECDIFIYYGPAGQDASAELGACWAYNNYKPDYVDVIKEKVPILGLWAKGENLGLMSKMVDQWFDRPRYLIDRVITLRDLHNEKQI